MPENFSAKLEIRSLKSQVFYPSDKAEKSKALTTFICQLSQSAKTYKTWQKPGNKISNGELSCTAAALLEKSVRVGVSLGDLLALRLKKQRQTIKQFRAINDLKLPYQNIKTENSKTQMSYQAAFAKAGENLSLHDWRNS